MNKHELSLVTDIPMPKVKPPKDVNKTKSHRMLKVVRARRNRLEIYAVGKKRLEGDTEGLWGYYLGLVFALNFVENYWQDSLIKRVADRSLQEQHLKILEMGRGLEPVYHFPPMVKENK